MSTENTEVTSQEEVIDDKGTTTTQTEDVENLKKQIADLRKEAANHRTKYQDAKKQLDASAPTVEQANARIAELEDAMKQLKVSATTSKVTQVATELSFQNPSLALSLIDINSINSDEDIAKALTQVAKDNPYLIKQGKTDASQKPENNQEVDMNSMLRNALKG